MAPVGGVHYPRSYAELPSWFPDDGACQDAARPRLHARPRRDARRRGSRTRRDAAVAEPITYRQLLAAPGAERCRRPHHCASGGTRPPLPYQRPSDPGTEQPELDDTPLLRKGAISRPGRAFIPTLERRSPRSEGRRRCLAGRLTPSGLVDGSLGAVRDASKRRRRKHLRAGCVLGAPSRPAG